jgi:hypothetical protein
LNLPSPLFSFIVSHPIPRIVSTHLILSIYIHMYIIFLPHSPLYSLSLYLPSFHWYQPSQTGLILSSYFLGFLKTFLFV